MKRREDSKRPGKEPTSLELLLGFRHRLWLERLGAFLGGAAIIAVVAIPIGICHKKKGKEPAAASPSIESREPALPPASESDVNTFVEEADELMPDLSVKRQPFSVIEPGRGERIMTYLVAAKKVDEHWFRVTDYHLDYGGDPSKFHFEALAEALNHAYQEHTPFPGELSANLGFADPRGVVSAGGGVSGIPVDSILQLLGLVQGVVELSVDRVEIAIKGYADGELSKDWQTRVRPLPPQYRSFEVLSPRDKSNDNWLIYSKLAEKRQISDPYTNEDLPDLRAQYIRHEFIEPFLSSNDGRWRNRCRVYVLHNKPLPDAQQAEWRKAQVYVMVYLKRTT